MKHFYLFLRTLLTVSMMLGLTGVILAQRIQISGKVTDSDTKETMIGVTVLEKGTTNGTTTDLNGAFKLSAPKGSLLVFSFVGYEPIEIQATESMNIQMKQKQTMLNQVVVVGYGTQNRHDVTGSIYKVKGNEIASLPVPSFDAGLQGRAPGVTVIQSSGLAGAGSSVKIRGVGSITSGGDPLYVIDGIVIPQNTGDRIGAVNTNPLNTINTDDIESIDILKDASATAIYGSRGANGVVIITTKRAKLGPSTTAHPKPVFDVGYRTTLSTPTQLYHLLNTEEYVKLYVEAFENDKRFGVANGAATGTGEPNIPLLYGGFDPRTVAAQGYKTTDWQKEVTRVGVGHAFDASMTYGNKNLASYFSVGYHNDESYLDNNSFNLFSARWNLDYKINEDLQVGLNASFANSVNHLVPVSWDGGLGKAGSTALPYWPIYDQTNTDKYYTFPQAWNGAYNPVAELENRLLREHYVRTITNAYLNYKIWKTLTLRLEGGVDYYSRTFDEFKNTTIVTRAWAKQTITKPRTLMGNMLLNYDFDINKVHRFKLMAGDEVLSNNTTYDQTKTVTFLTGEEGAPFYKDPTIAQTLIDNGEYTNAQGITGLQYGFVSLFGRAFYSYLDKYIVNVSLRRDASSRFGKDNKWGTFPAISVGWILSEEKFLKNNKILSFLKLKVGYGKTGNAEIPNDAQYSKLNTLDTKTYGGQPIRYITQMPNPTLQWETTNAFDGGIEFGILKDRINGSFEVYYKKTKDLYLNAAVPFSSGLDHVLLNVGELWNKGVELSLNTNNVKTQDFTWTSNFNLAYNKNEVTNTGHAGPDAFAGTGDTRVLVGYAVGVNYLVKELGVDPATGAPIYEGITKNEKGEITSRFKTFTYSTDYRQPCGSPWPDWIGSFTNNFSYKRWDCSLMFNFQIGGSIYDDSEKYQLNAIGNWNLRKDVLDRWQQPGDVTDIPRMTLDADVPNRNTDRYLHDASYLRLKSLSIGYNLPSTLIPGITKIRIALVGTNLLTWSEYPGMDPEIFRDMENQQQRNLSANVTYLTPPQARTYSLSVNVQF
ncbi:MAG: TonB-dependent receptor [Bacteroidetes bacterium]|nr:TonB-dependent receptor [Bacteroidota bacterium]